MLLAPRGTSALIIYKLSQAIEAICQQTDMKTKMLETGFIVQCEGPDELYGRMVREIAVWKAIIDRAGLKKE
jgi:tripartite-type tricarboxylate transporter receptor subunit TctC